MFRKMGEIIGDIANKAEKTAHASSVGWNGPIEDFGNLVFGGFDAMLRDVMSEKIKLS